VPQRGPRAGLLREREELAEVQLLALVGDIDDPVGLEFGFAREHRGDVGRGVVVAAVGFAHDAGRELLVLEERDEGAFALAHEAEGLELFDDAGQRVVVERLAADELERHAEAVVDAV
jgi:hypothetical protein